MLYLAGFLVVVAAAALVLVVTVQNSKGGGLNSQFGGSASQIMGARRSDEVIEKITWGLGAAVVVLAFVANIVGTGRTQVESIRISKSIEGKVGQQNTAPAGFGGGEEAPAAGQTQPAPEK